jgi:hypothetical protein
MVYVLFWLFPAQAVARPKSSVILQNKNWRANWFRLAACSGIPLGNDGSYGSIWTSQPIYQCGGR